jgi:hypothetical protein
MTHGLAVPLVIASLIALVVVWARVAHDKVGAKPRERKQLAGLQGRLSEWLYWDAPLDAPDLESLDDKALSATTPPAHRALLAVVRREALEGGVPLKEAYDRIRKRATSPVAHAFVRGEMGRAVRAHWSGRYAGPDGLFILWFYAVAYPRYGRRRLTLETLAQALKELRT